MKYKVLVYDRELLMWHIVLETNDKAEAEHVKTIQKNSDNKVILIDYE